MVVAFAFIVIGTASADFLSIDLVEADEEVETVRDFLTDDGVTFLVGVVDFLIGEGVRGLATGAALLDLTSFVDISVGAGDMTSKNK